MGTSYLNKIQQLYSELKGAEKRVGEYILHSPKDVIHLSITELAERCGSGEATIVRFCKKMNCKGYQDLKIRIASEVVDPLDDIYEDIREDDSVTVLMQKVFQSHIRSLGQTLQGIEPTDLQSAIDRLAAADNVAFFGMGGSAAVAFDAYHKFLRTGKHCVYQNDSHLQVMTSAFLTSKDCIVAISNTGSNKELVENARIAHQNGVFIIAVTSNARSPLSEVSDISLISFGLEQQLKSEAMSSRLSALCLLDCLYVGVCMQNQEEYFESVRKMRAAVASKRY
ncbi:MAG: MurR/RpiR family transcriptional regulator [Ethanoligenens sp.]